MTPTSITHDELAELFPLHTPPHPLDCRTCGACCNPGPSVRMTVPLYWEDVLRVPPEGVGDPPSRLPGLVVKSDPDKTNLTLIFRDVEGGSRCHFLEGTRGGLCSCTIYDDRPVNCRAFQPGIHHCLYIRRLSGLDTQLEV